MKRLVLTLLLLWLWSAIAVAKDEPVIIDIPNAGAQATALRVIEYPLDALAGDFAIKGPDGKEVPAAFDSKAKLLRFLASVPAGGGKFTLAKGVKSSAKLPAWKKPKINKEKLKIESETIDWASTSLENGLLSATVQPVKTLPGRLEIKALKGDYAFSLSPLGSSVGCVETEADGKKVDEDYRKGVKNSPELFKLIPCVPTAITIAEPDPFRRVIKVTCYVYARKNEGAAPKLFDFAGYDVQLTWNSPVVTITSTRKQTKAYYNHNGVDLNEIFIDQLPIGYQADDGEMADAKLAAGGDVLTLKFERAMLIRDKTGSTAVLQPDFKKLAIYKPCVVLASDRIMTILSQSWHEGWKAIEIKAGDYIDTMTLACNVGADAKTLKDWVTELLPADAAPPAKDK